MVKEYRLNGRGFEVTGLNVIKETPKQYKYLIGRSERRLNKSECNKITGRFGSYTYMDTEELPLEEIKKKFDDMIIVNMLSVRDTFERDTERLVKTRKRLTE